MGWLKKTQEKTDDLRNCLEWCAALYALEQDREAAYPFLVAAGTVYQTLVGNHLRSEGLRRGRLYVEIEAERRNLPSHEAAARLAKFDAMARDFSAMKTGIWASTKSKTLLAQLSPELLEAIQHGNAKAVIEYAIGRGAFGQGQQT